MPTLVFGGYPMPVLGLMKVTLHNHMFVQKKFSQFIRSGASESHLSKVHGTCVTWL